MGTEGPFDTLDLLILGAVSGELEALRGWFETVEQRLTPWAPVWLGFMGRLRLGLACLGIGKVNAAAGSAILVDRFRPAMIWIVGSAGAYRESPLRVGDVLVSTTVVLGDEGVWERDGKPSMQAIGYAVAEEKGRHVYERFDLSEDPAIKHLSDITPAGLYFVSSTPVGIPRLHPYAMETFKEAVHAGSNPDVFHVAFGPSVTVGMSSGDEWIAGERFVRYGAWAEDMEGSAVVQVCRRYDVPVVQCRGISNQAGVRDKRSWRMEEALAHCHAVVGTWLHKMLTAP
ncbi:MAG: hypothetical protein WHS46_13640 [Desulfosoma sp.]